MSGNDAELLREFAGSGPRAEQAFATLVERHLPLVYSVARRHLGSPQLAEDVAQSVFIDLARSAATLKPGTPLVAWLHLVSRRTALDTVRREARRHAREQAAVLLAEMKTSPAPWSDIAPLLDEAVESLPSADRTAILLRFFEGKSLHEIGAALGATENAAQKRVARALDQLRTFFARRGITVSAVALASNLSAHAMQLPPAALGASISSTAFTTVGATPWVAAGAGAATITMTTFQKSLLVAAAVIALGGAGWELHSLGVQRVAIASVRRQNEDSIARLREIRRQSALSQRSAEDSHRKASAPTGDPADQTLLAEINGWLNRTARLRQLCAERQDLAIPELQMLTEDQVVEVARTAVLGNESEIRDALATLRSTAEQRFMKELQGALQRYLLAHENRLPDTPVSLAPYLRVSVDPAAFQRYEMIAQGKLDDLPSSGDMLLRLAKPVDWERDSEREIGVNGNRARDYFASALREAFRAFQQQNDGRKPISPEQLMPFLPAPVEPSKLAPYFARP